MTPKNNKFHVWKEYVSFLQNDVAITNAAKKKPKKIWIRLNPINNLLQLLLNPHQTKILPRVFLHKRNQVVNVLLKVLPKSKIYST